MGPKEAFEAQILQDLPEGIRNFLSVPIPALGATSSPSDVDTAIVAQGILAHNLNTILKSFEGLTLAAIPMYIAQLNTVSAGLLAAGLEYVGALGEIVLLAPEQGGVYYGYFSRWKAELVRGGINGITGSVGGDKFEFEEVEENLFSADWILPIGRHTARVWGTYEGDVLTSVENVSFEIKSWADVPTVPEDGDVIADEVLTVEFLTGKSTDDISEDVKVSVDDGPPLSMVKVSALGFNATLTLSPGQVHHINFYVGTESVKLVQVSF